MSIDSQSHRDYSFVVGLLAGTVVGAGVMMLFAPATGADVRQRLGSAIDDVAEHGRSIRDGVSDALGKGAGDVEQFAAAEKIRPLSRQL